jgi:8-oxo-dGTP pyrophosphatase MutT (NUDIX family)
MSQTSAPELPSATILLLRQGPGPLGGLEVFMVKRHHAIDFASGALVFPGGKVARGDAAAELASHCAAADGMTDAMRAFAIAGIREAFEECGVLLARRPGSSVLLSGEEVRALDGFRAPLDKGQLDMATFAREQNLEFAVDLLVPYAHWITPDFMPKRFDTWFYLAEAPAGQLAVHGGGEHVDSLWINPQAALAAADVKDLTIVFATRMQLVKLARHADVATALTAFRREPVVAVKPERDDTAPGGPVVRIPAEAGYGVTEMPLSRLAG